MSMLLSSAAPVVGVDRSSSDARQAFYIASAPAPLFAWLHQVRSERRRGHAVLICAPAGCEQVHSHRALRHLAEGLADAGYCAVRFDYANTGDSGDIVERPMSYADSLTDTRTVLAWMRAHLDCARVSLLGVRLGAALAAEIAEREEVDNLILWEPIVRGRAYARELKALSMMSALPAAAGVVEAAGFAYAQATLDELSRIDLLKAAPKCRRALILSRDDLPADGKLQHHLQGLGIETTQDALPGYADMMAEPHFTQPPRRAITATIEWLSPTAAIPNSGRNQPHIDATLSMSARTLESRTGQSVVERILTISETPELFGILTEPELAIDLPLIVLPNAGSTYRVGPGRLYVELARRLAEHGFRTLRMDLAGLGDSIAADQQCENDCYAATAFRDIDLTLKHAQATLGAERIVLMGLCAGAYVAFQSAAQIANPALIESILINPLTYFWQEGMTLSTVPTQQHLRFEYYKASALQPRKWLKFLSGGTKIGVLGVCSMLARRFAGFLRHKDKPHRAMEATTGLGHPAVDDLPGDLERVENLGRQLACFFSRNDPGHCLLSANADATVQRLCAAGKMSIHFIEGADHTFSRQAPRQAFFAAVVTYLSDRYQDSEANLARPRTV